MGNGGYETTQKYTVSLLYVTNITCHFLSSHYLY